MEPVHHNDKAGVNDQQGGGKPGAPETGVASSASRSEPMQPPAASACKSGTSGSVTSATPPTVSSELIEPFNKNIPEFLDRTFRMIGSVSDDILCWSEAGDSFIVKQVLVFEELLPTFYNHNKFLSFVRQLNFYGFRKVRGGASLRSTSIPDSAQSVPAGGSAPLDSWEEFRHPYFRRGRRDLLPEIKRQKDGGRLKRKQAELQKSDVLDNLTADVNQLSVELKTVSNKLDEIMSLVMTVARNQSGPQQSGQLVPGKFVVHPQNGNHVVGGGPGVVFNSGGNGGASNQASFIPAAASAPTVHGGGGNSGGYVQWMVGAGTESGGMGQVGPSTSLHRTSIGNDIPQHAPMDQHRQQQQPQLQQWQGRFYPQQYQQATPAEQLQVAHNQILPQK